MSEEATRTVERTAKKTSAGLGTFGGVFVPSVLTILGIILFLRLGWVVGSGGLWTALIIIALSHVVSVLTSVSLAAIATNRRIRGGGDYYLISRSLGLEFGGSLGTLLFLAQTVSAGFYCFGFGEALARLLPDVPYGDSRTFALGAAVVLSLIAFIGADLAARLQYVIMAVIVAALVAFFVGAGGAFSSEQLASSWVLESGALPFWTLFAIFFPAVTGFTQGVSMSGDLKDPGRSLPAGTFGAVGVSIVVYFAAAIVFAGAAPLAELSADYFGLMNLSAGAFAGRCRGHRRNSCFGPRVVDGRATNPAGDGARRGLPGDRSVPRGQRADRESAARRRPLRRHRDHGHRPGEPQRGGERDLDVLSDFLRIAERRDIRRGARREPVVSSAVSLLRPSDESRRKPVLLRRDARDRPVRGRRGAGRARRSVSVLAAQRARDPLVRRAARLLLPAAQGDPARDQPSSRDRMDLAAERDRAAGGLRSARSAGALRDLALGRQARDPQRYGRQLRSMLRLGCNVAVFDVTGREWRRVAQLEPEELCIDTWWWENPSSRLALLFAYLVTRDERWEDARLRVLVPCDDGVEERARKDMANLLEAARIDAEFVAVPEASSEKVVEHSKESAIVFLPLAIDGMTVTDPFGGALEDSLEQLPIVCLIAAAKDVRLRDHEEETPTAVEEDAAE